MDSPNRHNGGPLSDDDGRKLWDHIRALEVLDEQAAEVRLDIKTRKELAKADGFDNNIIAVILKRRKVGEGESRQADNILALYEEALVEQGALPLEQTRKAPETRKEIGEIAKDLHGQEAPPNPRLEGEILRAETEAREARDRLDRFARENDATITMTGPGGVKATFGGTEEDPF